MRRDTKFGLPTDAEKRAAIIDNSLGTVNQTSPGWFAMVEIGLTFLLRHFHNHRDTCLVCVKKCVFGRKPKARSKGGLCGKGKA